MANKVEFKLVRNEKTFELDNVKNLNIPYLLKGTCPECGEEVTHDFEDFPLQYPNVGEPESFHVYCEECEHEHELQLQLDISLKVVENTK